MKKKPVAFKKVITRFGVVEMPRDRDPETITAKDFFMDATLNLIPLDELPPQLREYVRSLNPEPLPDLDPQPSVTPTQLLLLQVIGELEAKGEAFDWDVVTYHCARIKHLRNFLKNVTALIKKGLLVEGPAPRLTPFGQQRLDAQEAKEDVENLIDGIAYPLEHIESDSNPDYDRITIRESGLSRTYFRYQCRLVRARTRIVYLKRPEQ